MFDISNEIIKNTKKYQIESPEGLVDFYGINKIHKNQYLKLKFTNGQSLNCSEDHPIETIEGIIKAKDLNKSIEILTRDKLGCFIKNKWLIKKPIYLYDIVNSGNSHLYYSNDIISHNCNFLGSQNTLISASKLQQMARKIPFRQTPDMKIYVDPTLKANRKKLYIIVVDTSRGVGGDFNAFVIFDVSKIPYEIVGQYKNNTISPLMFPNIIYQFAKSFNDAYVCVEINDNGQQVADILYREMEYENMVFSYMQGSKGQQLSSGFGTRPTVGIRTTKMVKRVGCTNFKTLVEADKLIIQDEDILNELYNFIEVADSFQADVGHHDDLVMCCVLFSWLVQQPYFKDWTDTNVRERMVQDNLTLLADDILPIMADTDDFYDVSEIQDVSYNEFLNFISS